VARSRSSRGYGVSSLVLARQRPGSGERVASLHDVGVEPAESRGARAAAEGVERLGVALAQLVETPGRVGFEPGAGGELAGRRERLARENALVGASRLVA
jgi:hypothetical protein